MARASKAYDVFFSGCSWLAMYHVGVAAKLVEKKVRIRSFAGASSGSLIAVALASGVKPECLRRSISHLAKEARSFNFGIFGRLSSMLREGLDKVLPTDAHDKCSGRLEVSVTPVYSSGGVLKNWRVRDFRSRSDLIQCCVASCSVFTNLYKGHLVIDGGLWHNYPLSGGGAEADHLLVVNHRSMMTEDVHRNLIRPDQLAQFDRRHLVFPPSQEELLHFYERGLRDAEEWVNGHPAD